MTGFVTISFPFEAARLGAVHAVLDGLGNPASSTLRAKLDADGLIHFASINAFADGAEAYLIVEASGDAPEAETTARLGRALAAEIARALVAAGIKANEGDAPALLEAHRQKFGFGWFAAPALMFCGTPGLDAKRIKAEAELALRLEPLVLKAVRDSGPLEALQRVRETVKSEGGTGWAFVSEPAAALQGPPQTSLLSLATAGVSGAFAHFLWPSLVIAALVFLGQSHLRWPSEPHAQKVIAALASGLGAAIVSLLIVNVILVAVVYFLLRRAEASDNPEDRTPSAATIKEIMSRENRSAQNHLFAVSTMKPGWLRRLTDLRHLE